MVMTVTVITSLPRLTPAPGICLSLPPAAHTIDTGWAAAPGTAAAAADAFAVADYVAAAVHRTTVR